jgi:hypothetical protein
MRGRQILADEDARREPAADGTEPFEMRVVPCRIPNGGTGVVETIP